MNDYKSTLNLPQTGFAMKANLAQREPEILKRWEAMNLHAQIRTARAGAKKFILHDGPPYANGAIHLGHAVNKILKDMILKARTLDGLDAPYIPGWDCHGLPIELKVEQIQGKPGQKGSARDFRHACRAYAQRQINGQRRDFQRLGVIGDWDNPYLTMDYGCEAEIVRALGKIFTAGHVQRGNKPVHWCIDCNSALAEAEVEYAQRQSPAIDVKFQVVNPTELLNRYQVNLNNLNNLNNNEIKSIAVIIWTTTPWTLPANQAVALHPDFKYILIKSDSFAHHECFLIAEGLLQEVIKRWKFEQYQIIATGLGHELEGIYLKHPFYARTVPIILSEYVTLDTGTGAVHTAPGHGLEDYLVGNRYNLTVENPVGGDGKFIAGTQLFEGEHVFQANEHVIDIIKNNNNLVHEARITHSYPHCWRHQTPIIFRATSQWFISMDQHKLREAALHEINQVNWVPNWGRERIEAMVRNRPDWCISRQRTWGVPIPFLVHKLTGELHPHTSELLETIAQMIEREGIDAWFDLKITDLLGETESNQYEKVQDTLDVWIDSGVTHTAVLARHPALYTPADLYLEGSDQHRGWFQSSLLTGVAINGCAPYRQVLTHGFTVDAKGEKMSKTKGNVISPQEIIRTLGADIVRLWVATTDYRGEMVVSTEIFQRIADIYRRIRNTARFLLANLAGFDPSRHLLPAEQLLSLDRWVLDRALSLQTEIIHAYQDYQFHLICQKIQQFCVLDLGGFYLDVIKDRQYTTPVDSLSRRSCQTALYHVIEALSRWLAPILSFTAEEIWSFIPGTRDETIFTATWYPGLFALDNTDLLGRSYWDELLKIRAAIGPALENARKIGQIGSSLDAELIFYGTDNWLNILEKLQDELRFVFIVSATMIYPSNLRPAETTETELSGLWVKIVASTQLKCVRCWHHRADVGQNLEHPQLCGRCLENVIGTGETRRFA